MKEGERETKNFPLMGNGKNETQAEKKFQKNSEGQVMESSHQDVQK